MRKKTLALVVAGMVGVFALGFGVATAAEKDTGSNNNQQIMQSSDMQEQCHGNMDSQQMQQAMKDMMQTPQMQAAMKQMLQQDPILRRMMRDMVNSADSNTDGSAAAARQSKVPDDAAEHDVHHRLLVGRAP